jgi:putative membrane protein
MVAWFAGLFYMFRLFVYHVENQHKADVVEVLMTMERKLYTIITVPAMVVTFVFGFAMAVINTSLFSQGWFHVKLLLVILLAAYTGYIGTTRKRFARGDIFLTSKQCRLINEVPTLFLLITILWMVVFRTML